MKRFSKIVSLKQCLKGVEIRFYCDFNDCGRLFQIFADALEKARSPSVFFDRREWSSNWILDTMCVNTGCCCSYYTE